MQTLENKTCIITGANSGIGKAAAISMAAQGARLILVVRNRHRGEAALKEIISLTGNTKLEIRLCYLSSLDSVHECAANIISSYGKIDILVNNAGAYFSRKHITKDGLEASFQINYLSRFLFTFLLLEVLARGSGGRIINVNGEYHRRGVLDLNDINYSGSYNGMKAAGRAKLAELIFINKFAEKTTSLPVTINAVHPGIVATNAVQNDPDASILRKTLYCAVKPFLLSPAKGAETILYLAADAEAAAISGKYFIKNKIAQPSSEVFNTRTAAGLWTLSEDLTGIKADEIIQRIINEQSLQIPTDR